MFFHLRQSGISNASSSGARPSRRSWVTVPAVLIVLVAACGFGTWQLIGVETHSDQPQLFPSAAVAPTRRQVQSLAPQALQLMHRWWATHDTRPHDAAFVRWATSALPPPPSTHARDREVAGLATLARQRTPQGISAAGWLDDHGNDDVWKSYADQAPQNPGTRTDTSKQLSTLLDWTGTIVDALKNRFALPSPYVVDPALRPDKTNTTSSNGGCTCSYPSSHAASTAAAVTYLAHFHTNQLALYRHMQAEVDYSRLYMAGHVPSDLTAGTLLGDMLGEYYLVTRDHVPTH